MDRRGTKGDGRRLSGDAHHGSKWHPLRQKRYYTELANQFGRTEKAFEYRMQNISYICALLGRTWVSGLKPAKTWAPQCPIIERLLCELDSHPYTGKAAFEHQVSRYKIKPTLPTPIGIQEPQQRYGANPSYGRDQGKGLGIDDGGRPLRELRTTGPFSCHHGRRLLEVHHLRTLAEGVRIPSATRWHSALIATVSCTMASTRHKSVRLFTRRCPG